jgi:hypothetical protein
MIDQSEILIQFITLFFGGAQCVAPFTSQHNVPEFGVEKSISCAQPAHFDIFGVNLLSGVSGVTY